MLVGLFVLLVLLACCARTLDQKNKQTRQLQLQRITMASDDSGSKLRDKEQQRLSSK